jgi:hypothetical protein
MQHSAKTRDYARLLLAFANRAPFRVTRELYGEADEGRSEYRYDGKSVEGLGLAQLYGGFPVSLNSSECWSGTTVRLSLDQLVANDEAGPEINTSQVDVPHASQQAHVAVHRDVLTSMLRRDIRDAPDLYEKRHELFPNLEFGPRIHGDLRKLETAAFHQVASYLGNLDDAIGKWDPPTKTAPDYPPKTTDESRSRKDMKLCDFPVWGSEKKEPHPIHGRYTPGAGRIFFQLKFDPKRAVIGYIGLKP